MPFYRHNYPGTVAEILDDGMRFNRRALRAVRRFAHSRPWRGSLQERKRKFRRLNRRLARAYHRARPRLVFAGLTGEDSGTSSYAPASHTITIRGRLSVVTFLHEFAHALRRDERQATKWSVNLFRRCFPRSYARCQHVEHTLRRV